MISIMPSSGVMPENAFADYSVEKLYAFLSSFALDRHPGSKFGYSNVGTALLGHVRSRRYGGGLVRSRRGLPIG